MIGREALPVFHTPDGVMEMNVWVTTHSIEHVSHWIKQILKKNPQAYPRLLWELEQKLSDSGAGALETIVKNEENPAFQHKVWGGLELLSKGIQWNHIQNDDVEYVSDVLRVVGTLKVQPLYELLVQLTDQKMLLQKNLGEEALRLHVTALASLGAFGCNEQTIHIFERDIQDPFFSPLCYRMLWKFDRKYASQYADLMRKMGSQNTHFPTDGLLKEAGQI